MVKVPIGKYKRPSKVKDVISKIKSDGVLSTINAVQSKLDQPIPLGYCNVGTVIAVADDISGFKPGDLVASNGPHAEVVLVPKHLCALVPPSVSPDAACFTVLASIALQGIRLASPTYGETFLVSGLGLIGQLACQLLIDNGCIVYGIDPDPDKCQLASEYGVNTFCLSTDPDPLSWVMSD